MGNPKYFSISLLSSMLTMLPAVVFFVFAGLTGSGVIENSVVDNDPMRAGWGLLLISPIIFLFLSMFYYGLVRVLFRFKGLSFLFMEMCVFAVAGFLSYKTSDGDLNMFLVTFFVFGLWLSIGVICTYYLGVLRYKRI